MKRTMLTTAIGLLLLNGPLLADEIATTDSGKKVVLKSDGTWSKLESKVTVSEIMSEDDLKLDAKQLLGKTARANISLTSCADGDCFNYNVDIFVAVQNLPRSTRKLLLKNCEDAFCKVIVTAKVIRYSPIVGLDAISIEFQ